MKTKDLKNRILVDVSAALNMDVLGVLYRLLACSGCGIEAEVRGITLVSCDLFDHQGIMEIDGFPSDCPGRVWLTGGKPSLAMNIFIDCGLTRAGGCKSVVWLDEKIGELAQLGLDEKWLRLLQKISSREEIEDKDLIQMEEYKALVNSIVEYIRSGSA